MTVLLVLSILLVTAWLLRAFVRSHAQDPRDSVDGFARALGALDPEVQRRRTGASQPARRDGSDDRPEAPRQAPSGVPR